MPVLTDLVQQSLKSVDIRPFEIAKLKFGLDGQ